MSVLNQKRRTLEDAVRSKIGQHPWYTHSMIIILVTLVLVTIAVGAFHIYNRIQHDGIVGVAKCATEDQVDDVDVDVEFGPNSGDKQEPKNEYISMTDDAQ